MKLSIFRKKIYLIMVAFLFFAKTFADYCYIFCIALRRASSAICKFMATIHTKIHQTWCQNPSQIYKNREICQKGPKMEPKGSLNPPKATKMEPKGCQKGAKWRPKGIKKSMPEKGRQNSKKSMQKSMVNKNMKI